MTLPQWKERFPDGYKVCAKSKGKENEKTVSLDRVCYVGRGEKCELQLDNKDVSRTHAVLFYGRDAVYVMDLDSRKGTYVNGRQLDRDRPFRLRKGDDIEIGRGLYQLEVEYKNRRDNEREERQPARSHWREEQAQNSALSAREKALALARKISEKVQPGTGGEVGKAKEEAIKIKRMSTAEKRKLLWSSTSAESEAKKAKGAAAEKAEVDEKRREEEDNEGRKEEEGGSKTQGDAGAGGGNAWGSAQLEGGDERKNKFLRLLGAKKASNTESSKNGESDAPEHLSSLEKQREMAQKMEEQFVGGVSRGRGAFGLGFGN
uniref:FHA domain-containing protein n=1 Tax=Palpitomonas bilix TaxID=652834 RepID=A0A7S3GKK7_9EUKA|mmetsp:Transcript_7567/g.19583  ORF Transcript_7567/g.19583 Transcript_7567/m.19583 type:complete len:319 (+) Transcript_7567:93-1049(+)